MKRGKIDLVKKFRSNKAGKKSRPTNERNRETAILPPVGTTLLLPPLPPKSRGTNENNGKKVLYLPLVFRPPLSSPLYRCIAPYTSKSLSTRSLFASHPTAPLARSIILFLFLQFRYSYEKLETSRAFFHPEHRCRFLV